MTLSMYCLFELYDAYISNSTNTRLDFGARQVIIVRDADAREEIREAIGDAGLVLTLLESKGTSASYPDNFVRTYII